MLDLYRPNRLQQLLSLVILSFTPLIVEGANFAVVYPKAREPYSQVIESLVAGISSSKEFDVIKFRYDKKVDNEEIVSWIKSKKPQGVIVLSRRGIALKELLPPDLPVVVGGTFFRGGNLSSISGVSMAPSPKLLFSRLKQLSPNVTKINVVYRPEIDDVLMENARAAAASLGIDLNAIPAGSTKETAIAYRELLKKQSKKKEALWLCRSGKSLDKALMGNLLSVSWRKDLTVFSSNLSDVSRGVLFSLYPDNKKTGRQLGDMLFAKINKTDSINKIIFSSQLHSALNRRTAEHLGIYVSKEEERKYQLLFPLKR